MMITLLKAKIEELKMLFSHKSLNELERLNFVIETVTEPTLKDIKNNHNNPKVHNGIELPPTKEDDVVVEEKEG
mgnify:CR=1 FL=1